ncbi:carboxylesterase type B [Agromyces flavus]|uniref:Carboxylic ester hydrolase n=1 Tax=Agromyces flavus TaxID=589382 RepID=A0A1H1SJS0_9MICO|nr:carboxylesterase family protein [Agromyces flavus]MCP2369037.1 carboxylesterase type B [Agromyces flavus]SDS48171.1 para-nitrobenzyl esterase [Agromyces flavus]
MDTVVSTPVGRVRGAVVDGVHVFLGIPYAAPPFGRRRLRPPEPVDPWDGVRDATELGPEPPQVAPPSAGAPGEGASGDWSDVGEAFARVTRAAPSEDVLNLDLWTPDPGARGLPVMVWIQGGMFELSSTAAYDGSTFARDGVVCVVINWRPGAEGFLNLGDGIANVGLLDQVAALTWVRESIAAFGGDPDNVTVFGESAGAMAIGMLLGMPSAEGLFRRAILQSGAAHRVMPDADARRIGAHLAELLGVPPERRAIAEAGIDRLLEAQARLKDELMADPDPARWGAEVVATMMPWEPSVDGEVIPAPPVERIAAGAARDIDLIIGSNVDDWRLWSVVGGVFATITDEIMSGPVERFGYQSLAAYGLSPDAALSAYRARHPQASAGDVFALVQTDWWIRVPALRLADAHAGMEGRTYMYEFAWSSPGLGAVHALEIPFVFGRLGPDVPLFGPMLGADAPQELADTMHRAWIAFASTGDPGPEWPRYDLDRRATMRFDVSSQVVPDPRAWERELWNGVR